MHCFFFHFFILFCLIFANLDLHLQMCLLSILCLYFFICRYIKVENIYVYWAHFYANIQILKYESTQYEIQYKKVRQKVSI